MISLREVISNFLKNINPTSVLDLGCAKGRVSSRFFIKGIPVTGVDKKNFEVNEKNFEFILSDIREFDSNKKYDLIISSLVLHFLPRDEAEKMIEKMKQWTNKDQHNLLVCMSSKDDLAKNNSDKFFPTKEELLKLYADWEVVEEIQDFTDYETHEGKLPEHRHDLIVLLVKRIK